MRTFAFSFFIKPICKKGETGYFLLIIKITLWAQMALQMIRVYYTLIFCQELMKEIHL